LVLGVSGAACILEGRMPFVREVSGVVVICEHVRVLAYEHDDLAILVLEVHGDLAKVDDLTQDPLAVLKQLR
jgi:hypothetical protein